MTPEEAMDKLADRGLYTPVVRKLIDACVATAKAEERRECAAFTRAWGWHTAADAMLSSAGLGVVDAIAEAKAEAKKAETLRCVSLARKVADFAETCDGHKVAEYFRNYANDILITGRLEVDESDGKMKSDGPVGPS